MTAGIRTLDDLRDRCWIDEDTGCWHWRGGLNGDELPALWLPAIRQRVGVATAICVLTTGAKPPKGQVWHITCSTRCCCNPAHRNRKGTRSTQMLAAKLTRAPLVRLKMAATKRAGSKFSDEAVADIRASTEVLRVVAERYGCSISYASRIRQGEMRRPLVAPGSSVFSFGRAA